MLARDGRRPSSCQASQKDKKGHSRQAVTPVRDTLERWSAVGLDTQEQSSAETLLAMLKTI